MENRTTCIICEADAQQISTNPAVIYRFSCPNCGQYEITTDVAATLPSFLGESQNNSTVSDALRWWHETHREPFRLRNVKNDVPYLILRFHKASQRKPVMPRAEAAETLRSGLWRTIFFTRSGAAIRMPFSTTLLFIEVAERAPYHRGVYGTQAEVERLNEECAQFLKAIQPFQAWLLQGLVKCSSARKRK